ncbi:hypothetical protein [Lysinibacillus sp. 54212]|uniref:hypothetical protein n=1 Tax=Lysinibacillus sp. 54212 TaxID=3119829 RepID=UPI002FC954EC
MKKLSAIYLSCIVIMGVLAGCGSDETSKQDTGKQADTNVDNEKQASVEVDKENKEDTQTSGEKEATSGDIANAIDFTQALDPKKPVPFGTYMKLSMYSVADNKYHTVYVKLNKITSESGDAAYVNKAIEENNAEGSEHDAVNKEVLGLPEDIELNVLDYELVIPKEFPETEYGIAGAKIDFFAENIEGGGIDSNTSNMVYLALGDVEKLLSTGDNGKKYNAGNTYQLRGVFPMVKDFDKYVLKVTTFPNESDGKSGSKSAYFGIK